MIKSTIAALAATPLLFSGAAFAGPYVNVEASGSYPDGAYSSGTWEFQLGYEGTTPNGIDWYVSGGPTVTHTETADEFGDTELIGYIGGGKSLTDSVGVYGDNPETVLTDHDMSAIRDIISKDSKKEME